MCIDTVEIWFWITSNFDRIISQWHDNGRVLSFHSFIFDLQVTQIIPSSFKSTGFSVQEKKLKIDFQYGHILAFWSIQF